MKAMILAAGLGTRLRPLTQNRPKALVEVGGRTMLEITLQRLRAFGVDEVILNVHHFADTVGEYLRARQNFGMRIEISREDVLLDTGGGLKKAAWFFQETGGKELFLVHNVDVLSNIDLSRMMRVHVKSKALATLAVQTRATTRPLLFDGNQQFRGRASQLTESMDEAGSRAMAFSGIHVISPAIFERITEEGAFSIITSYARLAGEGERILGFCADEYYWRDLGRPESVEHAARDLADGIISA